jgi:predicted AAA+ superfamily ATPase
MKEIMLKKRYTSAQHLDGVIDLERLRSGSATSLEGDAAGFLELTYPSSDAHALVRGLSRRFSGDEQPGIC